MPPPLPPRPQHIDGINLFGLISIASLLFCAPAAIFCESGIWKAAWETSVARSGEAGTLQLLLWGGLFYHLYNQVGMAAAVRVVECSIAMLSRGRVDPKCHAPTGCCVA